MIEKKIRQWQVIRLLFILDIIFIASVIASIVIFLTVDRNILMLLMCNFLLLSLLSVSVAFQFKLYNKPVGTIIFEYNGITIQSKKANMYVHWEQVEHIKYYNFFDIILLLHFTLDLCINLDEESFDVSSRIGEIKINKKDYIRIVSIIPRQVLEKKAFMIDERIIKKYENKK